MENAPIQFDDGKGNVIASGFLILDNPLPVLGAKDVIATQFWPIALLPNGSEYTGSPAGVAPSPAWVLIPDMLGKTAAFSITLSSCCPTADSIVINGTPLAGWTYNQSTTVWAYDGTTVDANPGQISWTANKANAAPSQSNSPHYQGLGVPATDTTAPAIPVGLAVAQAPGGGANIFFLPSMDPNPSNGFTGLPTLATGNANAAYKLQRRVNGGSWADLKTLAAPTKGVQWAPTLVDVGSPSQPSTVTPTSDGLGFSFTSTGTNEFGTSDVGGTYMMPVSGNFILAVHLTALAGDAHGRICLTFRSVDPADPVNGAGSPFVSATFKSFAGGVGGSIDYRPSQGAQVLNSSGDVPYAGTDAWLCFQRLTDTSGNVQWTQYLSASPGNMGQTIAQISHLTLSMPTAGRAGFAFFGNGALLSGTVANLIFSTDPQILYNDSTATTSSTLYEYQVSAKDGVPNTSSYSASAGVTISTGVGLLAYTTALPTGTSKRVLIGTHLNYYQAANANPYGNQLNQLNGSTIATITVPNTSVAPAVVGCVIGLMDQNVTRAQNTKCIKDTLACGKIPFINFWPMNPIGYHQGTPFNASSAFPNILNSGDPLNTKFLSGVGQPLSGGITWGGLDELAATLLDVEASFPGQQYWFRPMVELNGNWFWWATGGAGSNAADTAALFRLIILYLRSKGVVNMLPVFNVNYGNGNYGGSKAAPYPGDDVVAAVSFDGYTDTPANFLSTYQALVTINKPIWMGEIGNSGPGTPPTNDDISIFIKWLKVNAPLIIGIMYWCQGWAPINQSAAGDLAAMTDPWAIGAADLPTFGQQAFYVSPSGSDSSAGTLAAPFKTLGEAQTAMRAGSIKTTFVRAGTYANTQLVLGASDNGQTWSYYSPDGYNTAILDGGASSPTTGGNPILIDGGSNITINGLKPTNCKNYGIGVHGGIPDASAGFPSTVALTNGNIVINNIIDTVYTTNNNGWGGGGVWVSGGNTNLTIANNVLKNTYGSAIRVVKTASAQNATNLTYTYTGLTITGNVLLTTNMFTSDNGCIYVEDLNNNSTGIKIQNNFIRDYQQDPTTTLSTGNLYRNVAVYCDSDSSNADVSGNIVAATTNAGASLLTTFGSTNVFYNGGGQNNAWHGNIIDLGASAAIVLMAYDDQSNVATGNAVTGNIIIGKWAGAQAGDFYGKGPAGYYYANNVTAHYPTVSHNLYYNYGGGTIRSDSTNAGGSDASPVTATDPLFVAGGQYVYTLSPSSPALSSPINFPPIVGGWGPPGYTIPSGTAPSYL